MVEFRKVGRARPIFPVDFILLSFLLVLVILHVDGIRFQVSVDINVVVGIEGFFCAHDVRWFAPVGAPPR